MNEVRKREKSNKGNKVRMYKELREGMNKETKKEKKKERSAI
jgi:hypothetical protein